MAGGGDAAARNADVAPAVAAHAVVAAGAKEQRAGHARAVGAEHRARFGAHGQAAAGGAVAQGDVAQPARHTAREGLALAVDGDAAAQLKAQAPAAGGVRQMVEAPCGPYEVERERGAVARHLVGHVLAVGALDAREVVLHVEVALGALAALRAAKAQLAVVGGQVVVFDAAESGQRAPAPAAGGGHGKQVAFHEGVGRFQLRLAHGAPAEPGHAVVAVLQRDARAAVGGEAQAQRGFFQRRFGHLHLHGGGDGGGGGVFVLALAFAALLRIDRDVGRVVIAAADQALLRVGQARLVIRLAHGQLRQPPGQKGGVAPVARDLHGA